MHGPSCAACASLPSRAPILGVQLAAHGPGPAVALGSQPWRNALNPSRLTRLRGQPNCPILCPILCPGSSARPGMCRPDLARDSWVRFNPTPALSSCRPLFNPVDFALVQLEGRPFLLQLLEQKHSAAELWASGSVMAGVVPARLVAGSLQGTLPLVRSEQPRCRRAAAPAAVLPPLASTSQPWGHSIGAQGQPAWRTNDTCAQQPSFGSCGSTSFLCGGHSSRDSSGSSADFAGGVLTFTEKDVRRRGSVQCAAGKKVTKKKRPGGGAFGVGGAGPRESEAARLLL